MTESLNVLLNGVVVGRLDRARRDRLRFTYDQTYATDPGATPLSHSMPLAQRTFANSVIAPWISGLLPDNRDVLRRWAEEFGVGSTEPFVLLATPIGEDCAGAVQFVRDDRLVDLERGGTVEWLAERDLEAKLRALREDETAWLGRRAGRRPRFLGQFSLAGRQRKTALVFEHGRWGVPSGRIPTTHILKPPISRLDGHRLYEQDINEHLCLAAAARVGLSASETAVMTVGRERVIVVTRYDRLLQGGAWIRVHQEDLCQALGVAPTRKYQWEGGPGLARIADLFWRSQPRNLATANVMRFADGVAWSWLVAGPDAHAKNYSLLLSGRQLRLAPLYDITSGLPYWRDRDLRMAMKLDDGYEMHNYRNPWPAAAKALGLDPEMLRSRLLTLCEMAPQAFADAAADPALAPLKARLPMRLAVAIEARARWATALLNEAPAADRRR